MCSLNETEKLQQQTWNFKFKHPTVQKHFQQYWQEFSSPLCCQRHGMHVHYLTPLKRVYSQLCLYSSHVNQPPFHALNCYSSTVAEGISPSSLLTWSVHPFSHFYREKTIVFLYKKILLKQLSPELFLKLTMKPRSKGVHMVYNNPLWVWMTEFCQKRILTAKLQCPYTGRLEESCCFSKTSHIILKTLNPWSLVQSGSSPVWGHDWESFK